MQRRWLTVVIGLVVVAAGCGGGSSPHERVISKPQPAGLDGIPTGSPTSEFWIAGELPPGYELQSAVDNRGENGRVYSSGYSKDPIRDRSDGPLGVNSIPGSLPLPKGRPTTVRGHHAVLATLTDEDRPYGVSLTWHEREDLTIEVSALEGTTVADARLVAAHVRPVSRDIWRRLIIATRYTYGHIEPGMPRVEVAGGRIGADRWTLTALLPPDYPVLAVDRRAACYELTFRGQRSTGTACWGHPSWERLGGQVFLFGEASPAVRRVVLRSGEGFTATVDAHRNSRWPAARFWVAPMPSRTCEVNAAPADDAASSEPRTLGTTGPLPGQEPDHSRCLDATMPSVPPTAPTAPGAPVPSATEVVDGTSPPPPVTVPTSR